MRLKNTKVRGPKSWDQKVVLKDPGYKIEKNPIGRRLKRLKGISTEANTITSIRYSFHSSSMVFADSSSFGVIVNGYFLYYFYLYYRTGHEIFFSFSSSRTKDYNILSILERKKKVYTRPKRTNSLSVFRCFQ